MKDRFTRGFLAGIIAGIVTNVVDYTASMIELTNTRYVDIAARLVYGRASDNLVELLFAFGGQLIFSSFLGVAFAYLIVHIKSMNYLLKGWFYGVVVWFFIFAAIVLYKVPDVSVTHFPTTFVNAILGSIFGLTLSYVLALFDKRYSM